MTQTSLLQCSGLSKIYRDDAADVQVLNQLDFAIQSGEHVAILGASGSGKSTLLHLLGALDKPTEGQVLFEGQDIFALNEKQVAEFRNQALGFVYQFHHLLPEFTAQENAAMPLMIAGVPRKSAMLQAADMLEKVGLSERLTHKPAKLSGGERQRVAIARALVNRPKLVLADEPTGNLDEKTGESIYQLLRQLRDTLDTSFVVVTHDKELANRLDRVLLLKEGELVEQGVQS